MNVNMRWTLPITTTLPEQLGQAAHGGSIVVSLGQGLTSVFAAQAGKAFRWSVATLTAKVVLQLPVG